MREEQLDWSQSKTFLVGHANYNKPGYVHKIYKKTNVGYSSTKFGIWESHLYNDPCATEHAEQ